MLYIVQNLPKLAYSCIPLSINNIKALSRFKCVHNYLLSAVDKNRTAGDRE